MTLAAGTQLGPYRIVSLLGSGGMGEVYCAEDSRLHRTVAIKILSPDVATRERIERFEQEARSASALNHPNILTIHDVGRQGDIAYFAMEWVDGQTLRQLLRAGPIPLRRTVQLAQQIAEGLASAHAAGIVHRDLKPENVMVTAEGRAKIVDFGLAKLSVPASSTASETDPTVTHLAGTEPGVVMGTVGYMSPEQVSGLPVDYRSDQFALGLLIYELVTRTRPFDRPTSAQSMAATVEADPPPIESRNSKVPPHLVTVVGRCLAKDPAERYESTRDLARDLKSVADGVSRPTPQGDRRTSPGEGGVRPASRRGRLAAIAAIAILAAAGLAAWLWRPGTSAPVQEVDRPLIAVRPFRSLSADPQQGYFAAGMTEEIRGQLSQVSSLRLLSRNGLDRYSDDVARAVRELGVGKIVDGSVRVDGKRVRVSAELVDAGSQQTLWSHQYDRDLADMLAVQSDIAQRIARALDASLSPHEQQRLQQQLTDNVEAYALYLQSQQMSSMDRARNLEAVSLLRKALTLDPRFATAQARIGYRLVFMGTYDDASYIDKGIAEAEAALRIDPGLSMGHFTLGTAYGMKGMDAQSRQAFLRSLELDPNNTAAMNNLSMEERIHGRLDEGLYWGRRAYTLSGKAAGALFHMIVPMLDLRADAVNRMLLEEGERRFPANARLQSVMAMLDLLEGQSERAVSRANALVARAPKNEEVKFHRADVAFLLDAPDLEAALEPLMQQSASNYSFWGVALSARLRYAYALGKRGESAKAAALVAEAERIARERIDAGNQTPGLRVELAAAAALRKDTNAAIDWLERALKGGYRNYGFLERDPILLGQLRTDARFHDVLEAMRRDVEAQRARARTRGLLDVEPLLGPAK